MEKLNRKVKWVSLIVLVLVALLFRSLTLKTHTFTPAENTIIIHRVGETSNETIGIVHHIRNYKLFNIIVITSYDDIDSPIPFIKIYSYDEIILYERIQNSRTDVTSKWTVNWK